MQSLRNASIYDILWEFSDIGQKSSFHWLPLITLGSIIKATLAWGANGPGIAFCQCCVESNIEKST